MHLFNWVSVTQRSELVIQAIDIELPCLQIFSLTQNIKYIQLQTTQHKIHPITNHTT